MEFNISLDVAGQEKPTAKVKSFPVKPSVRRLFDEYRNAVNATLKAQGLAELTEQELSAQILEKFLQGEVAKAGGQGRRGRKAGSEQSNPAGDAGA